ncbi:MAG: tripartite tricarboxylate transporter substrate binding protein [Betaproteobacteria bacterium]|nr:MAG: tripartite tricarboxylate transporter substrate binding protein [Betaproteobacteria bacterium]
MARMTRRHWCTPAAGGYHDRKRRKRQSGRVASAPIRRGSPRRTGVMDRLAASRRVRAFDPLRAVRYLVLAVVALLLPLPAAAQSPDPYPSRPVKLLIPYAPGGATDIIARHISPKLQEALGQPFVVDNRPGASGNIALEAAAKAAPDGYTLEVGNVSTNAINESTFADVMQIRPSRDLVGISKLVEIPHVVVAATSFPPNSVAEMIEWAKRNPGKLNYASAGLGTYPQLDMLRLLKAAGIEATHIPYKGGAGQMLPALLSGEVQVSFINLASTIEQIRAGRLKAIATTMPTRLAELPNVPTMAEQGFPGIGTNAWQGLFAPAATPKPILDKLHAAVVAVLSRPEMKEMLAQQLMTVAVSKSPQEFTDQVRAETQAWSEVVRDNKVKID